MKLRKYLCLLIPVFFLGMMIVNWEREMMEVNGPSINGTLLLEEIHYQKDGIDARYPKFVTGADKEKLELWNKIIEEDIQKILDIYSFDPFPDRLPEPTVFVPILNISYEVKSYEGRFFSVMYRAAYSSPYSAHPSEMIYTTNLDYDLGRRITLAELIRLDEAFVRDFRKWDFVTIEEGNKELNQAIKDYLDNIEDQMLLRGFQLADQIGSSNFEGIYSYLTPNRLGISLSVPHYAGDHVELEKDYSELTEFIR